MEKSLEEDFINTARHILIILSRSNIIISDFNLATNPEKTNIWQTQAIGKDQLWFIDLMVFWQPLF